MSADVAAPGSTEELLEIQRRARLRHGLDPETGLRVSDRAKEISEIIEGLAYEPPRESSTQRVNHPETYETSEKIEIKEINQGVTATPVTESARCPESESPDEERSIGWRYDPDPGLVERLERDDLGDRERVELAIQYQLEVVAPGMSGSEDRGSMLFDFTRAMLAGQRWREMDQAEFASYAAELLAESEEWSLNWPEQVYGWACGDDAEQLVELIYDAWHFVRYPLGFEPVRFAQRLARAHPLSASDGCAIAERLRRYGDALSILAWLDVVTVDEDAFVSERTLGTALGVKRGAARDHIRRAIREGWAIVTIEATKRRARRYRFDFKRLRDRWYPDAIETAIETIGELWASKQGLTAIKLPIAPLKAPGAPSKTQAPPER